MYHQWQTFNNCGPASIAILLAYYDHWITQYTVNQQVDPGPSPCQIKDYFPQYGLMARAYHCPPSVEPVRRLLGNGIPVIANQVLSTTSGIGHYRVIYGYNDDEQVFLSDDPLLGESWRLTYTEFRRLSNGGGFIAVYPPEDDKRVKRLLRDLSLIEITYCPP